MSCEVIVEAAPQQVEVNARAPGVTVRPGMPILREIIGHSTYIHDQDVPASTWTINHNLNTYPSVTIVDSAGTCVFGAVRYANANTIICSFSGAFSGKAYLN